MRCRLAQALPAAAISYDRFHVIAMAIQAMDDVRREELLTEPEEVAAAHKAGLQVVPWTANDPASWDALIAAQVDAIITDDPAALIAHLKAKGLR